MSDSAGVPWEGRRFEAHRSSGDDGSAPQHLVEAITRFRAGEAGEAEVVDAVRSSRLLVPLVAHLGEEGTTEEGLRVDKSQELSIVTVAGPDGRTVLPAFTSVDAMRRWNPAARPIPTPATRVALAAVGEGTDVVVIDPASPTAFALRRPALGAIVRSTPWTPSYLDPEVLRAFMTSAEPEPEVRAVHLGPGDPESRLAGPELEVAVTIQAGLDRDELGALVARLRHRWEQSAIIAERVDSLGVKLVSSPDR